jgi:hypothetical protein
VEDSTREARSLAQPSAGMLDGIDPLALVRRYEPVLRFTNGELFFPMSVESYVEHAALWGEDPTGGLRRLVDHGELTVDRLCAEARSAPRDFRLELRYVPGPLNRRQLLQWRRDPNRPRIRAVTRLAAVGLLGRLLDVLFRLSLMIRGRVPGGLVAAAHVAYSRSDAASNFPYYAHVSTDGGYVVIQYWFFYAMNNWRTSFAGVNDHEADWEHVTVYVAKADAAIRSSNGTAPDGAGRLRAVWVAFSSHDDAGAELRRRSDDPDLSWVDETHPVVYVGAGSHSGAHSPGDYLVRVEPPALGGWFHLLSRARELLMPWTRKRGTHGLGIPYVDYKRGDGRALGPGTPDPWTPVVVTSGMGWVRDYRGLWGLDTDDPFGGERAPAGPRYERSGEIRESWADPVAWAGLDPVPATDEDRARLERERLAELQSRQTELDKIIAGQQESVRRQAVSALDPSPDPGPGRRQRVPRTKLDADVARLRALRTERRAVEVERELLLEASRRGLPVGPHAHLRRRVVSDVYRSTPHRVLRVWSEISLSVLLGLVGLALLFDLVSGFAAALDAILVVLAIEALLRRRLRVFLLGVAIIAGIAVVISMLVTNLRLGIGVLAVLGALGLAFANLRALISRR